MQGVVGGFREESEPRDGDELSSDGELMLCGQRGHRSCVSEASGSREELKRHGSSSSKNSDHGLLPLSSREPPSAEHSAPQAESTDWAVQNESLNKQNRYISRILWYCIYLF